MTENVSTTTNATKALEENAKPSPPSAAQGLVNEPASAEAPLIPRAVSPQVVPEGANLKHPALYFNQELGWIDFNWRVLYQALDERLPLLERVRFVAITASNLDEFIQKRVGGLKRQEAAGVQKLSRDGRTPTEQLALIRDAVLVMHKTMTETWGHTLKAALRDQAGVEICSYAELTPQQQETLHHYFHTQIYPILTPLAVDPGHPFPFISNLSLSLAIVLRHPQAGTTHFARLKVPDNLERWLPIIDGVGPDRLRFLPVEQLIAHHVNDLFQGMEVVEVHPFRITRNADLRRDEEEADDLLGLISDELRERRFAPVVCLETPKEMSANLRRLLMRELGLGANDVYEVEGLLDLTDCFQIADLNFPDLKFKPWEPQTPNRFQREGETRETQDIFAIIRQGDVMVHHPYDSFTASVQRLIEEAAADDRVLAIKQTLYRTTDGSRIVRALIQAAESGKQVAVLIEVKARFDEANNIELARKLENAGVHVTYGLVGLKTHTKATLVVRQERDGLKTYCHIGTGNYHPKTARLYTDLGLLTCAPDLGADLVNLFHYLTGYAPDQRYHSVMVAPKNMRWAFNRLIEQEIVFQKEQGQGRIIAKMNALDDIRIMRKLYQASQVGVQIDLIVRGHSCLRPGLKGYSDNIRIISLVGRFLEHDRIFYFHNNGQPLTFIGSADWRGRNLNARVELITPIKEPTLQKRLIRTLEDVLEDNRLAWDLDSEGYYKPRRPENDEPKHDFHQHLMNLALERAKKTFQG